MAEMTRARTVTALQTFATSASLDVWTLFSPTQAELSHRVEVVSDNFKDHISCLCLQRKIDSFPLIPI